MIVPTQMITIFYRGTATIYCSECVDQHPDVHQHLIQALKHHDLAVSEPIGDEHCAGGERRLLEIPAYRRVSLVKPQFALAATVEIPARRAAEALFIFDQSMNDERLPLVLEREVNARWEMGSMEQCTLTYTVAVPLITFPPPHRSLLPLLQDQPVPGKERR